MSSDAVQHLKIGDFAQVKGGKRMPAGTALVSVKTQHPYLRIVDFKNGSIDKSNLQYVPDEVFPSVSRYIISSNDLYISIVGTIGLVGKVPVELSGANLTENAAKICQIDSTVMNRDYLGYFLRSEMGQGAISSMTVGSTQPKLALFRIEQIDVPCPALDIQESIVSILNALDDRIALLRETNTTLEAIAQALFKSWFVDFDPVHDKMQGRAPEGMDEATATLFPDSFEESELGPVPKGWGVNAVGDVINVTDYVANGSFAALKDNVTLLDTPSYALYVRTTDHNSGFSGGYRYVDKSAYDFLSKSALSGREVIISNVGDVGTVFRPPRWLGIPMTLGSNAVALKKPEMSAYLYFHFSGAQGQHDIQSIVTGSAQLKFNKTNFRALRVLVPDEKCLRSFEEFAESVLDRIDVNRAEIQNLTSIRDILLPRLISGQLSVADASAAEKLAHQNSNML